MGLQVDNQGGVKYREWAPEATAARLIGEFSELLFWYSVRPLRNQTTGPTPRTP